MKILTIRLFASLIFLLSYTATADQVSRPLTGASANTEMFYLQLDEINEISQFVDRIDLARLYSIRVQVEGIIQDMEENVKADRQEINFSTLRKIQNLIVQYRFSHVFFGWSTPRSPVSIFTVATAQSLERLRELQEHVQKEYGYDDSPYTQITSNSFRQMQKLMLQLEDLPIDPLLKSKLRDNWRLVGEVIAIAEQGDRPLAFAKAIPCIDQLRKFYPLFDQVLTTHAGFPIVLELQGLIEFYADYAQIETGDAQ